MKRIYFQKACLRRPLCLTQGQEDMVFRKKANVNAQVFNKKESPHHIPQFLENFYGDRIALGTRPGIAPHADDAKYFARFAHRVRSRQKLLLPLQSKFLRGRQSFESRNWKLPACQQSRKVGIVRLSAHFHFLTFYFQLLTFDYLVHHPNLLPVLTRSRNLHTRHHFWHNALFYSVRMTNHTPNPLLRERVLLKLIFTVFGPQILSHISFCYALIFCYPFCIPLIFFSFVFVAFPPILFSCFSLTS